MEILELRPLSQGELEGTEARLVDQLFDKYGVFVLGFDTVFAEPEESSGLRVIEALEGTALGDDPRFSRFDADAQRVRFNGFGGGKRLAVPLADERRFAIRRLAKQVLIDAHLAIALDVVKGDFQKKEEVVPKWIDRP